MLTFGERKEKHTIEHWKNQNNQLQQENEQLRKTVSEKLQQENEQLKPMVTNFILLYTVIC